MEKIRIKQQEPDRPIRIQINENIVSIFPKKGQEIKKSWLKKAAKEAAEGAILGLMLVGTIFGASKISAALPEPELPAEYIYYCEKAGQAYSICPELLEAIIEAESGGNPDAVGEAGEIGLIQIYPAYHQARALHLSVYNLFDPEGNVLVGADYLAELFQKYGDLGIVLMAYNGVADARGRGISGEYTEYARKIMKRAEQLERLHEK